MGQLLYFFFFINYLNCLFSCEDVTIEMHVTGIVKLTEKLKTAGEPFSYAGTMTSQINKLAVALTCPLDQDISLT